MTPLNLKAEPLRYLRGPIPISRASGWLLPDYWGIIILGARLNLIAAGECELATEEEALAHLHLASLETPLSHDWAQITLYLAQQVLPRWGLYRGDTPIWEALGAEAPLQLNEFQLVGLRTMRRRIRKAVGRRR
jgi:hypothetical protein